MSSRLERAGGRLLAVVTTPSPELDVGRRLLVRGNAPVQDHWEFLGRTSGRRPTKSESLSGRYVAGARHDKLVGRVVPDDELELDDAQALEACRREQQSRPVDLIGRVAIHGDF